MNSLYKQNNMDMNFQYTGKSSLVDNYTEDSTKVGRSNYEKEGKHSSYLN